MDAEIERLTEGEGEHGLARVSPPPPSPPPPTEPQSQTGPEEAGQPETDHIEADHADETTQEDRHDTREPLIKEEKKSSDVSPSTTDQPAGDKTLAAIEAQAQAQAREPLDDDGFVIIDPNNCFRLEKHKASFFAQMEKYLVEQVEKCAHYKGTHESQNNETMANLFSTHLLNSERDLDILRTAMKNNESLPKYKLETVRFNCLPVNLDVGERELQLVVRTTDLPVTDDSQVYIIGEFVFAGPDDDSITTVVSRWFHHVKVEPRNLVFCSSDKARQLDIIYSTDRKPFTNPGSEWLEFDRALSFTVTKGKSRTHKRKFKPIKLTFFEKTNLLKADRKIGMLLVRIDSINDDARTNIKRRIIVGRRESKAFADVVIRVRKPLVETTIRAHEEKLLLLS